MAGTTAALNDTLDDRYDGVTLSAYLTDGLTMSDTTTVGDVTGADVLNTTAVPGSAVDAVTGPVIFLFTNSTGSTVSFSGFAVVSGALVEARSNDISGSLEPGASYSVEWSRAAAAVTAT